MGRIVVLGGSGFVGRSACARLAARGADRQLTVPSRGAAAAGYLSSQPGVQFVEADVHDEATLANLVAGHDAVVNLIAILHGSEADFERVHAVLPRRLAGACKNVGVRRVVHVSAIGAGPMAPSRYLRSKARGELALQEAGLDLTILRPSVIFGEQDRFLNLFARLMAVFPVIPLAGADSRYQPVWVEDVAAAIVACLDRPETIGQIIECAGPRQYSLGELVRLTGQWCGHPRPVFGLPAPIARIQALAMELLPGATLMSRDNLDSMKLPNVASGYCAGLDSLGILPAALESVAPEYLGRAR
jgi:NADH dehydrogenase